MIKIIQGRWDYCCRRSNMFCKEGWKLIGTKQWSDGRWCFKMEK